MIYQVKLENDWTENIIADSYEDNKMGQLNFYKNNPLFEEALIDPFTFNNNSPPRTLRVATYVTGYWKSVKIIDEAETGDTI